MNILVCENFTALLRGGESTIDAFGNFLKFSTELFSELIGIITFKFL